ncbi:tripartite tricarboxylate transporter TctB family protein [Allonocardiopsis opalescens]|uniref:Putative tricarboxylic transport membrane protein n=1 Tax=Allonocardiopsis opalescens TaxID=1144618 RepID=A0A2T0Q0E1_9ACTN|nr:tripartite tricarboxylate transporter TctB family protein [Allonocardiopsis opalescens]PRX97259.1 putative tricarboxylic transport membrane protein [Allonocardiopsis opalescens]
MSSPDPDPATGPRPGEEPGGAPAAVAADPPEDRRTVLGGGALGLLLLVGAVLVLAEAAALHAATDATPLGPAVFPALVGALMAVVGVALVVRAARRLGAAPSSEPIPLSRVLRLAGLLVLLVGFAVALPLAGYVVSSTALFTGAALLLGAPRPWHTLAYGWTLVAVVYLVFDRLIGLTLPAGPWGF